MIGGLCHLLYFYDLAVKGLIVWGAGVASVCFLFIVGLNQFLVAAIVLAVLFSRVAVPARSVWSSALPERLFFARSVGGCTVADGRELPQIS